LVADVPVLPPPAALEAAQDRLAEKNFLTGLGLATAPYRSVDGDDDLLAALAEFGGRGVLKTRRLGYDGKGQRVFRNPGGVAGVYAEMGGVPLILEGLVEFEREISVVAARGTDGALAAYDPAENVHRDGILRSSGVPARISSATADAARQAAFAILDALDYVGVIGVELFVMADGRVLVNEIAPRVHNSGHWTEAACAVSQFEQHVRAICSLPLGDPTRHADCVMENLIGEEVSRAPVLLAEPGLVLHLYGKAETRPGRKMGHFTRLKGASVAPVDNSGRHRL
jgi:5-(carboxyamino)imidazole ribonucleotide synthase